MREQLLAWLVAAAYHSPEIIVAKGSYTAPWDRSVGHRKNAVAHGCNAASVAGDLYDFNLFHTQA